jgi:hypothetical protein
MLNVMASLWREQVRDLIANMPSDDFTLQEMYGFALPSLATLHPENNSLEDTLRRVMQELSKEGVLDFVSRGSYRRLSQPTAVRSEPIFPPSLDGSDSLMPPEPGVPDSVPLEKRSASTYAVSAKAASIATRREQDLVTAFMSHLESQEHTVLRKKIPTKSNSYLYTDPFDETEGHLYEAKADSTREHVRLAIGQLFDYNRYLHAAKMSVLLPVRPNEDMLELLSELGIGCTFLNNGNFEAVPPGAS